MNTHTFSDYALGQLRSAKAAIVDDAEITEILESQDEVLARYSPTFQPGRIETIEEEVLRSFLRIENNHHWSGLHRQVNRVCADMQVTRSALGELVNEMRPITDRM